MIPVRGFIFVTEKNKTHSDRIAINLESKTRMALQGNHQQKRNYVIPKVNQKNALKRITALTQYSKVHGCWRPRAPMVWQQKLKKKHSVFKHLQVFQA
jgi:hypothetical protein